jgi:tetratricopeptide (TPR) repeat protein
MFRCPLWILAALWGSVLCAIATPADGVPLEQRRWFETRTAHFNIYSCGSPQDVFKLAGRLEQFCKAYAQLAGTRSVASPPIVVLAFPDHESMVPFLPLYQGQPANLAAFFQHGVDENLIVLSLPEAGGADPGMEVIFHEYTHLLFRRNDQIWPLWLKEGMAEIYSTFQTAGQNARIASPIAHHLQTLRENPLLPLAELFAVKNDSPQYNERDRQGMFYAESWLLTHFLMAGDNGQYRARFGQFTTLLRQGQLPVPAFTNAMQASLPAMESGLRRYLERGVLAPIGLTLATDLSAPISVATRYVTPVEVYFRLGDELLRIDRQEAAEARFIQAQRLAPKSPLPEEGLGLLANIRGQHEPALGHLKAAIQRGSTSFLTYYICALEEFHATAQGQDQYGQVNETQAAEIRRHLAQSIALMPDFGPSQQLSGFFEMVQGDRMAEAGQHLQRAIQLEPENLSYQLSLAQYQYRSRNPAAARQTLEPLLRSTVDARLRADAMELQQQINQRYPASR